MTKRKRRTAAEIAAGLELVNRTCRKCNEEKDISEFRERDKGDGYHLQCKVCKDEASERNFQENLSLRKEQSRSRNLMNSFGITIAQYSELLKKQDYKCAICDRHRDTFKVNLAVDHNHTTGEIRGLLCQYCNHRVIGRHRNGDLLRRMAEYVDSGTGWFVPKKRRPVKRKPGK